MTSNRNSVQTGQPLAARQRGDDEYVEVHGATISYNLDAAAAVLAVELPHGSRRLGRRTMTEVLTAAGKKNLTGKIARQYVERHKLHDTYEYYRTALVKHHVYSQNALDRSNTARGEQETHHQ